MIIYTCIYIIHTSNCAGGVFCIVAVVFELALSRLDLPSPAHDHVVLEPLSNAFSLYSEHDLVVNGNGGCGMCLDGSGVSGVCLIVDGVESSLET